MNRKLSAAVAAVLAVQAMPVMAEDDLALEEVIVSAQRRSENIQDVPIAIQALTGETLSQLKVSTVEEFVKYLPNVTLGSAGPGEGNIYMRGLSVGGSVRYVFGKPWAAINVGGQTVLPARDTDSYVVVSPFVSYRAKWRKISWTAQVNVNNLFAKVTDQGTAYRYTRWSDPRQIITTVSVSY